MSFPGVLTELQRPTNAMPPACRRQPSEHAIDVHRWRMGHGSHGCMLQVERCTQHNPLSAPFNLEHCMHLQAVLICRTSIACALRNSTICNENEHMTHATRHYRISMNVIFYIYTTAQCRLPCMGGRRGGRKIHVFILVL